MEKISEITARGLQSAVEKYLHPLNKTTVYVIPGGKREHPPVDYQEVRTLSGSAAARIVKPSDFSNHSIYPTPRDWKHPLSFERKPRKVEYVQAKKDEIEGVPVFHLPDQEIPLIDLTLLVRAGSVDVENSKWGLSNVLSESWITGGTATLSPLEFAMMAELPAGAVPEAGLHIGPQQPARSGDGSRRGHQCGNKMRQAARPGPPPLEGAGITSIDAILLAANTRANDHIGSGVPRRHGMPC